MASIILPHLEYLTILEEWLLSYDPHKLFDQVEKVVPELKKLFLCLSTCLLEVFQHVHVQIYKWLVSLVDDKLKANAADWRDRPIENVVEADEDAIMAYLEREDPDIPTLKKLIHFLKIRLVEDGMDAVTHPLDEVNNKDGPIVYYFKRQYRTPLRVR